MAARCFCEGYSSLSCVAMYSMQRETYVSFFSLARGSGMGMTCSFL